MPTTYHQLLEAKQKLEQQQAELERRIAETQGAEKANAVERIKSLMIQYGIKVADLEESRGRRGRTGIAGPQAPVKYRDSKGNSWSGRGLQPRWLKVAIAEGKSLQDFAV